MEVNQSKTITTDTSTTSIKIFFLIAIVVLLVFAMFSFQRIKALVSSSEMVNETNTVKLKLEEISSILKDAESSQRGYMLTHDSVFLKPFFEAKNGIKHDLDELALLTKDNPVQKGNLLLLEKLCNERIEYLGAILEDSPDSSISKERWLGGKSIMDELKLQISMMNDEENRLLKERSDILSRNEWNTPAVTIILIICALLIIILSYYKILRELRRSNKLREEQKLYQEQILQANESLKKSEERYHLMAREVQDYAILFLNKEGTIENWNKGGEKIKGYTADEVIGKHFSIFYSDNDRNEKLPENLISEALKNGKALHEGWLVRKDGTTFWGSIVITTLRDKGDNVLGFSKVTRDLTDKKLVEENIKEHSEELEKKNVHLENMNNELQSFAYVASHDLQEPLRKIQIFAGRITENDEARLSLHAQGYFKRIQDSAKRMQILIDDLLEYAQMNGKERKFERIQLSVVIKEVVIELKETIKEKQAIIHEENSCELTIIHFQFRQLIQNLLNNAMKFSKPGIPPKITIASRIVYGKDFKQLHLSAEKKYCHISLTDNGIGFEPTYNKRIFEIFQRLHGRAEYKGTGIGLAICKKIVENHEGVITAESEEGNGSTFHIYIPHYEYPVAINK